MRLAASVASFTLAALAAAARAQQPAAPAEAHVRGVVAEVAGDTVTVKSPDGRARTTLKLSDRTRVSLATKGGLDALRKDAYVGVTAVEAQGGTLRALEVHVFPEAMRGAGEGHRPWDLEPGSSMTNAMVSGVDAAKAGSGSTMTNATVSGAAGAGEGKRLELTYKDGRKTVLVPPGTPVVVLEKADRSAVAAGDRVFAAGPGDAGGTVTVERMVVGKNGVVPPM